MSFVNATAYWEWRSLVESVKLDQQTENERAIVCEGLSFYEEQGATLWHQAGGETVRHWGAFLFPKPTPYNKILIFFWGEYAFSVHGATTVNVDYRLFNDLCAGIATWHTGWTNFSTFMLDTGAAEWRSSCHDIPDVCRGFLVGIRLRVAFETSILSERQTGWLYRDEYGVDPDYDGP